MDGNIQPSVSAVHTPLAASKSGAANATVPAPASAVHDGQAAPTVCLYLRDGNNSCTVHLIPHARNACYARLRVQQRWWSALATLIPTPVDTLQQERYCFGAYVHCPFFYAPGTAPPSSRVAGASQKLAA